MRYGPGGPAGRDPSAFGLLAAATACAATRPAVLRGESQTASRWSSRTRQFGYKQLLGGVRAGSTPERQGVERVGE